MAERKVLVVEDEQDIAELLALHLKDIQCEVTLAADGHEGMRQAFARDWDLVILDLCLPGPDGLSICRKLRRESRYVPILMLTSKSSELDRVLGLELGNVIAFAVVTETIFAWPGMGKLIIDSIGVLDRPIIVAYLLITVTMFIVINFIVDVLYSVLDPRVRLGDIKA